MEKLKLIIDTDIGDEIDDALAIYYAMRREYDIIGITCVYKNTEERARITKRLLSLYGKGYESVPVFAGHGTPLAERGEEYPHTCHYHEGLNERIARAMTEATVCDLAEKFRFLKEETVSLDFIPKG